MLDAGETATASPRWTPSLCGTSPATSLWRPVNAEPNIDPRVDIDGTSPLVSDLTIVEPGPQPGAAFAESSSRRADCGSVQAERAASSPER